VRVRLVGNVALRGAVALRLPSVRLRETAALVAVLVANGLVRALHELLAIAAGATTTALVVGLAAADSEEPEEASTDRKCRGNPDCRQVSRVEAAAHAVEPSCALDGADDYHRGGRCERGRGADCHSGNGRDDERDAREGAAAVSKDAEEQLDGERHVGDDEGDLGPARNSAECGDGVRDARRERDVLASKGNECLDIASCLVQRGLGPVESRLRAVARSVLGSIAVTPETDIVDVVETQVRRRDVAARGGIGLGASCAVRGICKDANHVVELRIRFWASRVEDAADREWRDGEVGRVDLEHVQRLVGDASKTSHQQRNQRSRAENERQRHADKPPEIGHLFVCGLSQGDSIRLPTFRFQDSGGKTSES